VYLKRIFLGRAWTAGCGFHQIPHLLARAVWPKGRNGSTRMRTTWNRCWLRLREENLSSSPKLRRVRQNHGSSECRARNRNPPLPDHVELHPPKRGIESSRRPMSCQSG